MSTEIRKIVITAFGDPSVVQLVTANLPDPAPTEVQVKVSYSGFSGTDINMRLGVYPFQKAAPLTPGYCLVGRVTANGSNSKRFAIGDLIACLSIYDGEATYANLPEKFLVPVPQGLDEAHATALIVDWNTAYGLVYHGARGLVKSGQKVFVHGLSGAVGYAIMMLCLSQGATVYGTASARNHAELRELGATPYAYNNKTWISEIQKIGGVHVVFDPLGFESWDESYSILSSKEKSVLVGYGGNLRTLNPPSKTTGQTQQSSGLLSNSPLMPTIKLFARNLMFWSYKGTSFWWIERKDKNFVPDLNKLFDMVLQQKIQVRIKQTLTLEGIQDAHINWTSLTGMGSIVVKVD